MSRKAYLTELVDESEDVTNVTSKDVKSWADVMDAEENDRLLPISETKTEGEDVGENENGESVELDLEWVTPTVLICGNAMDKRIMHIFSKYFDKNRLDNTRIWSHVTKYTNDTVGENFSDVSGEDEQIPDTDHRNFKQSKETGTFNKLFEKINEKNIIDGCVEAYCKRYPLFDELIMSVDEYECLLFEKDNFFASHCDAYYSDESYRKLTVICCLDDDYKGGIFHFNRLEEGKGLSIRLEKGDILVFPSCPIHEYEIKPITEGELHLFTAYLI